MIDRYFEPKYLHQIKNQMGMIGMLQISQEATKVLELPILTKFTKAELVAAITIRLNNLNTDYTHYGRACADIVLANTDQVKVSMLLGSISPDLSIGTLITMFASIFTSVIRHWRIQALLICSLKL